jgi:hypothetical protein
MTARGVYLFAIGLFTLLAIGIVASVWLDDQVGQTGMHGPVALVYIFPFLILFAIGAVMLTVLVFRARLDALPTFIGLLPIGAVVIAVFGVAIVVLSPL